MVVRSRLAAPASRPANKRPPQTNALTFGRRTRPVTLGPLAGGDNLGDIYEKDDGTVYGDGVNVAARLESLAEPGGITVSEDAYRQVEGKTRIDFQDIGEHEVKNITRPVRAYRVTAEPDAQDAADTGPSLALPHKPSIAVLAFDN